MRAKQAGVVGGGAEEVRAGLGTAVPGAEPAASWRTFLVHAQRGVAVVVVVVMAAVVVVAEPRWRTPSTTPLEDRPLFP